MLLFAAWIVAAGSPLSWLGQLATSAALRHNAALLALGLLLVFRAKRTEAGHLDSKAAIVLVACAWLIALRPLDANLIAAAACITGSALLLGCTNVAAIALCCIALPIDAQLDAFIGLPARMITAQLVAALLSAFSVPSVTGETVLQLESGLADIESACSGVRSLWVGALVFLGVSAIVRTSPSARWVAKGCVYALALLAGNLVRVTIVVTLAIVLKHPALADLIHAPLGHLVFVLVTVPLLWALKAGPAAHEAMPRVRQRPLVTACLFAAFPLANVEQSATHLQPVVLDAFARLPLSTQERSLFQRQGAQASKWQFDNGTVVVVVAPSLRAHHAPEVCMASLGHRISMRGKKNGVMSYGIDEQHTGVYWFQSPTRSETSLIDRAIAEMSGPHEPWALVSVVFDGAPSDALLTQLKTATAVALEASRAKSSL